MIPGVGAVYNGQYAKGLVHVVIVGLLISNFEQRLGERTGTVVRLNARLLLVLHGV